MSGFKLLWTPLAVSPHPATTGPKGMNEWKQPWFSKGPYSSRGFHTGYHTASETRPWDRNINEQLYCINSHHLASQVNTSQNPTCSRQWWKTRGYKDAPKKQQRNTQTTRLCSGTAQQLIKITTAGRSSNKPPLPGKKHKHTEFAEMSHLTWKYCFEFTINSHSKVQLISIKNVKMKVKYFNSPTFYISSQSCNRLGWLKIPFWRWICFMLWYLKYRKKQLCPLKSEILNPAESSWEEITMQQHKAAGC